LAVDAGEAKLYHSNPRSKQTTQRNTKVFKEQLSPGDCLQSVLAAAVDGPYCKVICCLTTNQLLQ